MRSLLTAVLLLCALGAQAGTPCENKKLDEATLRKAMSLAEKTYRTLDASGAQVALIARVGQDLSAYKLRYSHMGFVWRDHPQGRWMVVHELNECGTADSNLYNEGLGNFFLDGMFAYETLILYPGAEQQAKLAQLLASPMPQRLHAAAYNMLAFPFATRYQNSNQWLLETYAAAQSAQVQTRSQAQTWLQQDGYRPITLEISALTRLGARMFRANVAFDDQPFDRRMGGHIDTVTVDSVQRYLRQRDPELRETVLRL